MPDLRVALVAMGVLAPAVVAQTDSSAKLPGAYVERDTTPMVSAARISALPVAAHEAWQAYVTRSAALGAGDRMLIDGELRRLGAKTMVRAPYVRESFIVTPDMTEAFFSTARARDMARTMLSFQTPSGGWSKHVDMSAPPRRPGQSFFAENEQWQYIATLDNDATTSEMVFLGRLDRVQPDSLYRRAFLKGLRWLLDAQMPNGCWPQVYPLQGGYHDAVTFNDDAIVNAVRVLADAAEGVYPFVAAGDRALAGAAVTRAEGCIRAAQVVVDGKRTIWAQQHDPLTLAPVGARSYEPASLGGRESVGVLEFLLSRPRPDAGIVRAIHAAAAWYGANKINGLRYKNYQLTRDSTAPPLWARMSEVGTNRPIFSNRDGRILYDWNGLGDRRSGYGWYTDAPTAFLAHYEAWARTHPPVA